MIAAELAVHLGADLGLDSVGDVWDEIERLAAAYRGMTRAVLDSLGAADGVVVPLTASPVALGRRAAPLDPIAFPGVESVERQGAPPRAGLAEPPTAGARAGAPTAPPTPATRPDRPARPARSTWTSPGSRRWTATRCGWWPRGRSTTSGPAVERRARPGRPGGHRHRCGSTPTTSTTSGSPPVARSGCAPATASMVAPAVPDPSLPRKVVAADFNVPLGRGDHGRSHRRRRPGGRGADGDP